MPAASLAELFDFETNIENAFAGGFDSLFNDDLAPGAPEVQILTPRTLATLAAKKITPRIELALAVTGSPEQHGKDNGGVEYRSARMGTLSFRCVVRRNKPGQSLGYLRGTIRAGILKGEQLVPPEALPFYQILYLEEAGSVSEFEGENDEIHAVVSVEIHWDVNDDQFPTP